jgi:ketosteroid isomerase-like protein
MKNLLILFFVALSFSSLAQDNETKYRKALIDYNKKVVGYFFDALERKDYNLLKGIFDIDGKVIYPGVNQQESVVGRENIVTQFELLMKEFAKTEYSTEINVTDDPTLLMVKVKGDHEKLDGNKEQNNYLATFKLKNGKIVEYMEYNNSQNRT